MPEVPEFQPPQDGRMDASAPPQAGQEVFCPPTQEYPPQDGEQEGVASWAPPPTAEEEEEEQVCERSITHNKIQKDLLHHFKTNRIGVRIHGVKK